MATRTLFKRSCIRLLTASCIWILFAYGHLKNYRYTWYYRYRTDETELHMKRNEQFQMAQLYWDQLLQPRNYAHNYTSDICTVLISSPRGTQPTLHYTLSSLLTAMTSEDKLTMKVLVYNTARPSHLHKYADQLSRASIPYLQVIDSTSTFESELYSKQDLFYTSHDRWTWTESVDYLTALSLCRTTNSSQILILEDDVIFTRQFFSKLRSALNSQRNCTWIRLFETDFWNGWEDKDAPFLILLSIAIAAVIMFIWFAIDKRKYHQMLWKRSVYSRYILFSFWVLWSLLILVILISVNRQNMQFVFGPSAGVHPMKPSVAGTLAICYPLWIIPTLEKFLRNRLRQIFWFRKPIPIDLLLIEFLEQTSTSLKQCHLVPDLVDHIGVYSSSIAKNQGSFENMKQSGTFQPKEASVSFKLD